MNFKNKSAYKKWLAHGHIHGLFASTPGNQRITIREQIHKVKH